MRRIATFVIDAAAKTGMLEFGLKLKRSHPVILMYHGVSAEGVANGLRNCEGKHIAVDLFVSHLRVLRRSRRVISLHELVEGLCDGRDLSDSVVITFDDGYQNNALVAAPILADFNISAAFFLTTGFIGTQHCIWTDRLEVALDRTQRTAIHLPGAMGTMPIGSFDEKRRALFRIKALLKVGPMSCLNDEVDKLANQLGVADIVADGDYHFMHWEQARELVRSGFEVGAHTVSHPILTNIPFEEAAAEILDSRDKVQQETGQCSSTFCFPNGKITDINAGLLDLCRKHFKAALSTERGVATAKDLFELKRLCPAGLGKGENIEWMLLRAH